MDLHASDVLEISETRTFHLCRCGDILQHRRQILEYHEEGVSAC